MKRGSPQRASCGERHTHGKKRKGPCDFPKELFTLTAVLGLPVEGLLAYLLGNRGGGDATFLAEIFTSLICVKGVYYNPYFTIDNSDPKGG